MTEIQYRRFHFLDRRPSGFRHVSKWTPGSNFASEYGSGSPYPSTNMDLWGTLWALVPLPFNPKLTSQ